MLDRFQWIGPIAWAELPEKIEGELFVPLLPDAEIVVTGVQLAESAGRTLITARLGHAKRPGMSLQRMRIGEFDPVWGGRWDAGSNSRPAAGAMKGTALSVRAWVEELRRRA